MSRLSFKKNTIISIAVVSFIIAVTAAFPQTTPGMRSVSEGVRILALILLCGSVLALTAKLRLQMASRVSVFTFIFYFSYGLFWAVIFGGHVTALKFLPLTLIIVSLGLLIFSQRTTILGQFEAKILVIYVAAFFLLTVALGGFLFEYPPRFMFQIQTGNHGSTVAYGQGVTKFFGIGAILAAFLCSQEKNIATRWALIVLTFIFLVISLLGGARGDSIAAILAIVLIYFPRAPLRLAFLVVLVLAFYQLVLSSLISLDDFILIRRLEGLLSGSIGARQQLYDDAINLLEAQPYCFIFGCGFDYYQAYYGFSGGYYPHNFILEFLIVFGLPLTCLLFVGFLVGIIGSYLSKDGFEGFLFIVVYFSIIFLKSGSVISGWLFVLGQFYYFGIGVQIIIRKMRSYAEV